MSHPTRGRLAAFTAGTGALALTVAGFGVASTGAPEPRAQDDTGRACVASVADGPRATQRQRAFEAASRYYGVPQPVLMGVSYLESRWDDHGQRSSLAGGYGPMHLTDVEVPDRSSLRGDGTSVPSAQPEYLRLLGKASRLTGLSQQRLRSDDVANICGGAAVLASYQRTSGNDTGARSALSGWAGTVGRYQATPGTPAAEDFARRVYVTLRSGQSRVTNDGQTVRLGAERRVAVPSSEEAVQLPGADSVDCPSTVDCEAMWAPYEWYGAPDPEAYGNHDVAHRPQDLPIKYILIHDTETPYEPTTRLATDPTYVSWHYTMRSSDGHVAQHLRPKDVGWHAGNWYVNQHSIGIEHEGYAADGSWYTENMYQASAELVKYLAQRYGIPLDRAHIIGHDQVPGSTAASVRGMHWDPGPFWNWQHYFELMGAPVKADRRGKSDVWYVAPRFADNAQPLTGCMLDGTTPVECDPDRGTNVTYVHTAPDPESPLVEDIGLHPKGGPSTTDVSDIGARLPYGQKVVVTQRSGDWAKVWFLGQEGWIYAPKGSGVLVPSQGRTVTPKPGVESVPVYGRAYPERSAYPAEIPYQEVSPLQYSLRAGQRYVVTDTHVPTDYYYAKTYDNSIPKDHTVVRGDDVYYQIAFGHRFAYVRAADVTLR